MKRLISKITVAGSKTYVFDYLVNAEIVRSWDKYTQTCKLEIPNKFQTVNGQVVSANDSDLFSRGDSVVIEIGYFPNLEERFTGFISEIESGSPFILHCQDEMWKLKRKNIESKSWTSVTIQTLIEYVLDGTGFEAVYDSAATNIGGFAINNNSVVNAVDVLEKLKKQFGMICFFKDGVLNVRFNLILSGLSDAKTVRFSFNENIIDHSLNYKREDDTYIYIQGENIAKDNTRTIRYATWENGEIVIKTTKPSIGEQKVMKFYNVPIDDMEETLKRKLPNYVYTGFEGTFTTLGEPTVDFGDIANLIDTRFPERSGEYSIKSVTTTFGTNGYRQVVQPYSLI